ncbi:MAG TPA: Ig-like domain-containing protein, partial [Myxococcota bacterium]|nr:Ig-like domain-containing protein [Myxococcota bacterium]
MGPLALLGCLCGPLGCGVQSTDTATRDATLVAQDMQVAAPRDGTVAGILIAQGGNPDTARYELVANGQRGTAALLDPLTGTFSYTATSGQLGFDTFTFRLHDGTRVSNVASVEVAITDDGVAGLLTYDFVPTRCDAFACQLDYAQTVARPIRHAVVRLVDDSSQAILSETFSDEAGRYLFARSSAPRLQVVVMAEMREPPVVVRNNTDTGEPTYALVSDSVDVAEGRIVNLNAPSGWDGKRYAAVRSAAPFAILDVAYRAAAAYAAVRPITFAPLIIDWSTDNRP